MSGKAADKSLKVYFIVGEMSGDVLGARIIDAFEDMSIDVDAVGLAGEKMQEKGISSLYDISDLSVMGISGVVSQLPNLMKRINQTAKDVVKQKPDVLLLIDAPDFSYRVAKKVRALAPDVKIVKFVAPSVWAWRPGRAKKIKPYIDHILAILPFEPEVMQQLDGPETTYVGHPLSADIPKIKIADKKSCSDPVKLLMLPGSRQGEFKRLMPVISNTVELLHERNKHQYEITIPAVEKLRNEITQSVKPWPIEPNLVFGTDAKLQAFEQADLALCASGTVTLELALYKVPMISIYKLDRMMMAIRHIITAWTTALPNLIADYIVVPEKLNENAHPAHLARLIERLSVDGPERQTQLQGFKVVEKNMQQKEKAHNLAVKKILEISAK